jgi:hypothetical protein
MLLGGTNPSGRHRLRILPYGTAAVCSRFPVSCVGDYDGKLTRSHSLSVLVDGEPIFSAGRFTIGLTSRENSVTTYHLHLSEDEARRFAAFIAERVEFDYVQLMR